ncbi:agmatinase family protein [Anaeromyxobacter diazotrophicus]|uniref:Agmatinase n=1 Tax=Anaeromyxobacter diazotrophicus TaxID=2590199 RepID=A0A7I9VNB1_9BACT|nr:agmatinase family protein [Anaeromyxobacter diazotrophicus]GEJ57881.1 agmatinase [Anaeromyxobacter diazotrophicus]
MPFDPSAAALEGSGVFGLPHSEEEAAVVLVPVPFEATTSYGGGASGGPAAILEASRQVDLYDVETGRPYEAGIHMLPIPAHVAALDREARAAAAPVIAAGGAANGGPELAAAAARVDAASREVNDWVEGEVRRLLAAGKRVGLVGGDHAVAFGSIAAHAAAYPGMGVLHLDAHADLRLAFEGFQHSHASVLRNVMDGVPGVARLVQVGIRDVSDEEMAYAAGAGGRVVVHHDALLAAERFEGVTWGAQVRRIVEALPRDVYLSFDIDGLDPTLCPHTGTPVPGGLSFQQACALLAGVVASGRRIVGLDLVEVAPGPDGDAWDGNVGARLLYKMIGWMLKSRS